MSNIMDFEILLPDHSDPEYWLPKIKKIKNNVIGSNTQKERALNVVPKLLSFLENDDIPVELKIESAIVLGSFAKGPFDIVQHLAVSKAVPILLKGLQHPDLKYVEALLRCLKTIICRVDEESMFLYQDPSIVPHLISILCKSVCTQECVATIFSSSSTQTPHHQYTLYQSGAVPALTSLLSTNIYRVQLPVTRCLTALAYRNHDVSTAIVSSFVNNEPVTDILVRLQQRDQPMEMQMCSAKCLAYMCRAGAIDASEHIISHKTLATLIYMCKPNKTWEERVEGAEILGYLTEVDVRLQNIAAISDHILTTLGDYFNYPGSPPDLTLMPTKKDDIIVGNELRQAAFRAYASLSANNEDVRKKIIDSAAIMRYIVNGLTDPVTKVQAAAIRCLHSLSRSVQQLRTSFHDNKVWKPIVEIFISSTDETLLCVTSSIICNLLLEFSPSKELILNEIEMVEDGSGNVDKKSVVIEKLVGLTHSDNPSLRLNAIWAFMNLTFHSTQEVKEMILKCLRNDDIFHLIRSSDRDVNILMKTLGTVRNLLSAKSSIDRVMTSHGRQVMESVILVLEGDHPVEVKEQALCILTNVSDGVSSKDFIMDNADVLRKIMSYLMNDSDKLQIAATNCIYNLINRHQEGYQERQQKFNEMQCQKVLQELLETSSSTLFERVKLTLQEL